MASLADTPLPRLLVELHRQGFEGWVSLERGNLRRRVQWQGGVPTRLDSTAEADALVERLIARGLVGEDARTKVRRELARKAAPELAVLVGLKLAPPRELLAAVGDQLRTCLLDAMTWETGSVSFEPASGSEGAPAAAPVDVLAIAAEGVARHWRADQVLQGLGDRVTQFPAAGDTLDDLRGRLPTSPAVVDLLENLGSGESAFNLLRRVNDPLAHGTLWLLDACGALEWSAMPPEREEPEEAESDDFAQTELEIIVADTPAGSDEASAARATAEASSATDAKAETLRTEILKLYDQLQDLDYWALLGVDRDAPAPKIKKAYLKAAKRLHPDKVSQAGLEDVKDAANELFAEITRAHQVLTDPDERRAYEASLEGHTTFDADRLGQAEALFRKGEIMMKAGSFREAHELLEAAVSLWPEEADYQAALAWTLFKKTPPEDARAIEHFEKALSLNEDDAVIHARFALVLKANGEADRAASESARAQALDPQVKV